MKPYFKRLIALCLCLATVTGFIPAITPAPKAEAAMYSSYTMLTRVPTQGECSGMQGMDVDGNYIYCAKIDDDTTATIARVNKESGALTWMTNADTGGIYFSKLFHANDLAICTVNGVKTMFVGTGGAGAGQYSLARLTIDGTTLKLVGHYNMKYNGSSKYMAGVKVVATSSTEIDLVLKQGDYVFTATIPANQNSGDIAMDYVGKLDFTAVNFGGTIKDISDYVQQGFGYKDGRLFVPMTANHLDSTSHISTFVCFDIDGLRNATLKPDPNMSVWIEDSTYVDLFEIESCSINPYDGKLYFVTNSRKSSSDGNHDGVHVLNGYTYSPTMGDLTTGQNFHFVPSANTLKSVTTGASVYNSTIQHLGTVSGTKFSGARFSLDAPIILKHNEPWILTWESSNWTSHSLFLSTYDLSGYAGNKYLYRRAGSGLIALGCQKDGQYHNYGVSLSSHGIDDTKNHKYQLRNEVNADGTNMVYLWVDGTRLGAMNNYYIGATSQNTTDNWVSGQDFAFSYIGTPQHPFSSNLKYLKVWTKGNINAFDEPNVFRWETTGNALTPITQFNYTTNAVTTLGGTCSGNTFSNYYARLAKPVVLMHDKPWVVEWKTPSWSGNTMLFSSGDTALKVNASYLYRSKDIVAFGYSDGTTCHSYGLKLADFGVSVTAGHTYRLSNKINADGTNMVYLTVDGVELGAMNKYYLGSEYQNKTTNFVNGKDFTFPYLGNYNYGLNQNYNYIQVWENGIPADDTPDKFRWEPSGSSFTNITANGYTANTANRVTGSLSGSVFNEATYRLNTPIVLRHNHPWSISWQSSGTWAGSAGGAFLFSASLNTSETNAPYLYRRKDSGMIGIGYYNGSQHVQYGLQLSDFGIDGTTNHTYTLTNRINTDGSNMVYLSVDGQELGAMNQYFVGAAPKGTTSDWLSGKDFTFPYLGTPRFPISNVTLNYLDVNEGTATTGTVVFKDWDGTVLSSKVYNIGDTVSIPADPTRPSDGTYTYTFAGWDKDVTVCNGNAVYTATYTTSAVTYTVTFKNWDGTVLSSKDYNLGDIVSIPADPTRPSDDTNTYTFAGWDKDVTVCNGNAVYTATYTTDVITYTVTFKNWDGTVLSSKAYTKGAAVFTPDDPTRPSDMTSDYFFAGWDKAVTVCTGNAVYTATYTSIPIDYAIIFKDYDGTVISTSSYYYGDKVTPPADPVRASDGTYLYTFAGWTPTVTSCKGDAVYTATYSTRSMPVLTPNYPAVSFEDQIQLNIYFTCSNMEDVSLSDIGLLTWSYARENGTIDTAETITPGALPAGDKYFVHTPGIPAKNMGNTVYFKIYAQLSDGTYVYSRMISYSPKAYALQQITNSNDPKIRSLCVAMLNYGAAAQTYFQYQPYALMNSTLTATHQSYVTAYDEYMIDPLVAVTNSKTGNFTKTGGYSDLHPSVSFEGAFSINYYATPNVAGAANLSLYYWSTDDYNKVSTLTTANASGAITMEQQNGQYVANVAGIAAKDLDKTLYVAIVYEYGGTRYCSGVIAYSVGRYLEQIAANTASTAQPLAAAAAVYSYYAKLYFAKA